MKWPAEALVASYGPDIVEVGYCISGPCIDPLFECESEFGPLLLPWAELTPLTDICHVYMNGFLADIDVESAVLKLALEEAGFPVTLDKIINWGSEKRRHMMSLMAFGGSPLLAGGTDGADRVIKDTAFRPGRR